MNGSFPLTPALSLRERENRIQPLSICCDWIGEASLQETGKPRLLFPLPKGEGQGEGELAAP
jgi:hypothetical protein